MGTPSSNRVVLIGASCAEHDTEYSFLAIVVCWPPLVMSPPSGWCSSARGSNSLGEALLPLLHLGEHFWNLTP